MRRLRERGLPVLLWALLVSTILHFVTGPLIATLIYLHILPTPAQMEPKIEEQVVTSTAVRIERRAQPRPAHPAKPRIAIRAEQHQRPVRKPRPRVVAVQTPVPQTPTPQTPQPQTPPPTPPRAINVTPQPQRKQRAPPLKQQQQTLNAESIAQQESEFAKTIAQARKADNPLIAARSTALPATTRRHYHLDFQGAQGSLGQGQGYLEPVRAWRENGWIYYYVRYEVEYADGTVESGIVPWPIHYPPGSDPFELGVRHLPLPGPPPGYDAPPGEDLHPLIKYCLEHHFEYCPIEHG